MVQEVYLKLWNKCDELVGVLNIEVYCVIFVKNLCYDVFCRSWFDEDGYVFEELNFFMDINIVWEVE